MERNKITQDYGRKAVVMDAAAGHPMAPTCWEATGIVPMGLKRRRRAVWKGVRLSAVVVRPPGVRQEGTGH